MVFELNVFFKDKLIGRSTFDKDEVRIGRAADNEVQIDNLGLSRYHASIEHVAGVHLLKDFGSQNGTFVNGEKVTGRHALNDGDRIGLGKFLLVFRAQKAKAAERALVQDEAAFAVAGETIVARPSAESRERACPWVGYLEEARGPKEPPSLHLLARDITVAGSAAGSDLAVAGAPRQAAIVRTWNGFQLLALAPGVRRNGEAVELRSELKRGDALELGATRLVFQVGRPEAGP